MVSRSKIGHATSGFVSLLSMLFLEIVIIELSSSPADAVELKAELNGSTIFVIDNRHQ